MTTSSTNQQSKKPKAILTLTPSDDPFDFYSEFDATHGKESRHSWYNTATDAYLDARPRYPDAMVQDALTQAKLTTTRPEQQHILEIGCGPGTATVALARLGYHVTALDPAPQNAAAAQRLCQEISDTVQVIDTTFEEYNHHDDDASPVSAIVCSNSFHWISPDVACQKTAELLRPTQGCLLLWWTLPPMPSAEVCDAIQDVYDDLDLSKLGQDMRQYGLQAFCETSFQNVGQQVNDSGYYQINKDPLRLQPSTYQYTPKKFITLLSTLSPYIALPEEKRATLFERLEQRLNSVCPNPEMELTSYFGFQIFWVKV